MGLQCGRYDTWELSSYWVNEAIAERRCRANPSEIDDRLAWSAKDGEPDRGGSLRMTQESSRGVASSTGSRCQLTCLTGQISHSAVQPHLQKYFRSGFTQIKSICIAVPPHSRGVGHRH